MAKIIPSNTQHGYIYVTTNLFDGSCYIGQHRGAFYPLYLGSGKILRNAIKKYGRENFVVTEIISANNQSELDEMEIAAIKMLRTMHCVPRVYNIVEGGCGVRGIVFSKETREKMSKSHKGFKPTAETRKRLSLCRIGEKNPLFGRHHSAETRAKISASKLDKKINRRVKI